MSFQRVMMMAEHMFGSFLPDCGLAFSRRMESMPGPSETQASLLDRKTLTATAL
jgi:hypothetical protein